MKIRRQIAMDPELRRWAHAKAAALAISFSEYRERPCQTEIAVVDVTICGRGRDRAFEVIR